MIYKTDRYFSLVKKSNKSGAFTFILFESLIERQVIHF